MNGKMRTVFYHDLNKGSSSEFPEGYQVWQNLPEEGWRVQQQKHWV